MSQESNSSHWSATDGNVLATHTTQTSPPKRGILGYPSRSALSLIFFLMFVVARYVQLGARREFMATIRAEFLLGLLVILVVWREFMSRKPAIGDSTRLLYAIVLLFVVMGIQVPFAADPVLAREVMFDRVIKFALLTFFMVVLIESPRYMAWFIGVFLFSLFYITLESVRGLITGGLVWENQGIMRLHGAVPIYAHPNSLAGVSMGALPFVIFLFLHVRRWYFRLGLIAVGTTSLLCVIYSGSRTAYVGIVGLVFYWWLLSKNKIRFFALAAVLGSLAVLVVPDQYIERFESIGGKEKEGSSKETRIEILRDAFQIFKERPLGVGIASFPAARTERFGRTQDTHNLYLEVATNLGIQGFVVFVVLAGIMMHRFVATASSFHRQRERLRSIAARRGLPRNLMAPAKRHYQDLGFLAAISKAGGAFIFIRLVLGLFGMDLYEVYWWFGAGLAVALSALVETSGRVTRAFVETAAIPDPSGQ